MKYLLFVPCLFCSKYLDGQTFTVSMKPGDVRVYQFRPTWVEVGESSEITQPIVRLTVQSFRTPGTPGVNPDTFMLHSCYSNHAMTRFLRYFDMRRNPRTMTIHNGILHDLSFGKALIPLSPPSTDTLSLTVPDWHEGTRLATVTRRFDTTIFELRVRAFSVVVHDTGAEIEMTVAERFGLVRFLSVTDPQDVVTLINATIEGEVYNPERRRFDFFPMCVGDVRHFFYEHRRWMGGPISFNKFASYVFKDSLIDGKRYFQYANRWQRSDSLGLYFLRDGVEVLQVPSNATIGTVYGLDSVSPWFVVCDTGTVQYFGQSRRRIEFCHESVDDISREVWIEGFGLTYWIFDNVGMSSYSTSLQYARLCGKTYGTPSLRSNEELPIPTFEAGLYPNPVPSSVTHVTVRFTTQSAETVSLELYDVLGRHAKTIGERMFSPGEHELSLSTEGLRRGVYFTQVRTSAGTSISKLVVQ